MNWKLTLEEVCKSMLVCLWNRGRGLDSGSVRNKNFKNILYVTAILLDAQQKRIAWVPSQQLYLYLSGILSSSVKDKQQEVAWLEKLKAISLSPGQNDLKNTRFQLQFSLAPPVLLLYASYYEVHVLNKI